MKGPVKLSLAVALALAGGNAFALGLGSIQVKSGLNQPLDAEIPVIADSPAEANALTVDMASAADFERIGLSRSHLTVPIDMVVTTNARGETVVKLTTKEPVREPLIDFLIVANWTKGKLLREFTVLLDPPVTAPVAKVAPATVAPVAEKPVAAPQPLPEPKAPPPKPPRAEPKPPVATAAPKAPKPAAAPPPPPPVPAAKPAARPATGNDYGPVAEGETLSEIARATRPDEKTTVDQMMLALFKSNPKAFYQDNINALKRGAILRIPSSDELRANGTWREVADQVRSQNAAWAGKIPVSAPTLVAKTGGPTKPKDEPAAAKAAKPEAKGEAKTAAKPPKEERLALVPPSSSKSDTSTDRAGAAGGTGKDNAALKAELARTKEALTSREQEATELKSRVKQLEDIGGKDQRLISLKDSEIADLQKKLKDLQGKVAAAAATPAAPAKPAEANAPKPAETPAAKPAETAAAKPETKLTAKDIWGDLNAGEKTAKPAAGTAAAPAVPAAATPSASTPTPPAAATATPSVSTSAPATPTSATTPGATTPPAATTPATTPSSTTAAPTTTTGSTTTTAPAAAKSDSTPAATDASATTAPSATTAGSSTPPNPATSTTVPAKPTPAGKVTPLAPPADEPFYRNQNVLLGGGAALLLIGLLALTRFMRKPRPALAGAGIGDAGAPAGGDEEELRLRDALQQNPANTAASLELLRHYYANGEAAKFEAAAETMHAHLANTHAPEWDEVLAMGAVLAPNHPLFSAVAGDAEADENVAAHDAAVTEHHDEFAYPTHTHDEARTHVGTFDDVGLTHVPVANEPAPQHDDAFDFDLPMHSEETPPPATTATTHVEPEPIMPHMEAPAAAAPRADDIYVGEDAIGTKLDLAKAYLDMGDPEGAKSMLDEVLAEGNDTQQDEARKLLAEIR